MKENEKTCAILKGELLLAFKHRQDFKKGDTIKLTNENLEMIVVVKKDVHKSVDFLVGIDVKDGFTVTKL